MSVSENWSVSSQTYHGYEGDGVTPKVQTVTEWSFSNGVRLHYNNETQELDVFLPVRESVLSVGRTAQSIGGDQIGIVLSRMNDVVTHISISPIQGGEQ